jgi:hypothetical protein
MAKKKKKRKLKPRTIWLLSISYFVIGFLVAILFLNSISPETEVVENDNTQNARTSPWMLFPVVVMLWPIFVVVMIARHFL